MTSLCRVKMLRLEEAAKERGLDEVLVFGRGNLAYFTEEKDLEGFLVVHVNEGWAEVYVPSLEYSKAVTLSERCDYPLRPVVYGPLASSILLEGAIRGPEDPIAFLKRLFSAKIKVGVNLDAAPCALRLYLERCDGCTYHDVQEMLSSLRRRKTEEELERARRATEVTERAILRLIELLDEKMTQRDARRALVQALLEEGSQDLAFPPIVALDLASSYPHPPLLEVLERRRIGGSKVLLVDAGAVHDGYASDVTRVVILSYTTRLLELCDFLEQAFWEAFDRVAEGVPCRDIDAAARLWLSRLSLHRFLPHSLGHGVGVEVHEAPAISPGSRERVYEGDLFTIEPGVYFPGAFGLRIEDPVKVRSGRVMRLSRTEHVIR